MFLLYFLILLRCIDSRDIIIVTIHSNKFIIVDWILKLLWIIAILKF